jgi:hypothetical protein
VLGVPFLTRRTHRAAEVDLVPTQVAGLRGTQAVPLGQEDHGGVAVTVAVAPGSLDQGFDLLVGQVLAGPQLGVLLLIDLLRTAAGVLCGKNLREAV